MNYQVHYKLPSGTPVIFGFALLEDAENKAENIALEGNTATVQLEGNVILTYYGEKNG